jgi:adenosylhomocysteine nucleosidase
VEPAVTVLFAAALPEESVALAEHVDVLHLGVGKVQAAATLAGHLAAHPEVELVVNVGTAGALRPLQIGEVLEVGVVHQHDFDQRGVSSFVGRDVPGGPIELPGPRGASARLATGDRVVVDPRERARLARHADLVDMEGYAVAAVCARFGVPAWLVKAVSDTADAETSTSWPAALQRCSSALARWAHDQRLLPPPHRGTGP